MVSSTRAASARIPETALERGREFVLRAERMALEPATRVSPQSPSPATNVSFEVGGEGGNRWCRIL